jgi:cytidylate kinase
LKSVIISGMPSSGKTTIAKKVAERFGLKYLSGGDLLKDIAVSKGYEETGEEWWDTDVGMRFLEERKKSYKFDILIDQQLEKAIDQGGVVVTSPTAPWLVKKGVKIWLKAHTEVRTQRLALRDKITNEKALKIIIKRDSENINLYKKIYGFTIGKDLSVFHLVLDTDNISKNDVIEIVCYTTKYLI